MSWVRRNRAAVAVGASLVGMLVLLSLIIGGARRGDLDPDAYDPNGAHALAVLLAQQGVQVERTTDVPSTIAAATTETTVFVPLPSSLSEEELQALAPLPGDVVVAEATPEELGALGATATATDADAPEEREPGCELPLAVNAGRALTGGFAYAADEPGAVACYRGGSGASLLSLPSRRLVLLGNAQALTNDHLDEHGNAALGIGLLGRTSTVVWFVPAADRAAFGTRPPASPDALLPDWVRSVRLQLFVTLAVLALWRGRRLGRVVIEQLPVVVRAAETVEGHGRLYRAARARGTAGAVLREATLRSLARLTHGGPAPAPDVLSALVAERTGRDPVGVRLLLYGPPPADDAELVLLADRLDALTRDALSH